MNLPGEGPHFLRVKINKTVFGNLANLVFRASLVQLRVTLADGSTEVHRLIPGMAEAGFIVDPYIASSADLAALMLGRPPNSKRVVAFSFESGRLAEWMYRKKITLEIQRVLIPTPNQILNSSSEARAYADEHLYILRLASNTGVVAIPEGVFAHAPKTLEVGVEKPASRVILGFGLVDGAWKAPDGTKGVCFILTRRSTDSTTRLYERCLNPANSEGDRGEQVEQLETGVSRGDILQLETRCRIDCRYAWSYWSRLVVR
jgi:hypothetical protein